MQNVRMKLTPRHIGTWIVIRLVPWKGVQEKLFSWGRMIAWLWMYVKRPREDFLPFRCNVCGRKTSFPREELTREGWSCVHCQSTVRWRSVIRALSTELFGEALAISDFPIRPDRSEEHTSEL